MSSLNSSSLKAERCELLAVLFAYMLEAPKRVPVCSQSVRRGFVDGNTCIPRGNHLHAVSSRDRPPEGGGGAEEGGAAAGVSADHLATL